MPEKAMVIPAIDLREGKCVRLRQGDYNRETVFNADPVETAREWVRQGARLIHVVDLDGARRGHSTQLEVVQVIADAVDVPVQLGGGLRTEQNVQQAFEAGVARAVLGSAAMHDPKLVRELAVRFPSRIIVSIDARDGEVQGSGWLEDSSIDAVELAGRMDTLGLAAIVFTDIARDGMLSGPNLDSVGAVSRAISTPLIAAGGVGNLEDIRALAQRGVSGIIVGRALYDGCFTLTEAIEAAGDAGDKV